MTMIDARAGEFDCELDGDRRHLRLDLPGEEHLCEVSVAYRTSGERRVVWYADNDTTFCSDKLDELATRYRDEWGFECARWPDPSGVERLGVAARALLDDELRALRAAVRARGDGARVTGVRALSRPGDANDDTGEASADLRQFFVREADGTVRTVLRLTRAAGGSVAIEDLAAGLSSGDERIEEAWVDAFAGDGGVPGGGNAGEALHVVTLVRPPANRDVPVPGEVQECRGAQTLGVAADGTLVAITPHRYSCEAGPLAVVDPAGE